MSGPTKSRPTLNDIAAKVGVTKMTVSRFLRDPNSVAITTREKIAAVIEDIGYVHSRAPDILSNRSSMAIGILIPSLSNQVFSAIAQGIESVTKPAGYQTLIAHYGYSPEDEEKKVESLLSYHVDGLIMTESQHTEHTIKMIKTAGIPVVETMDIPEQPIDLVVGLNHRLASAELVESMIARGKKHILYFGARLDRRTQLRMDGYNDAMEKHGLTPINILTEAHSSFTVGRSLMDKALEQYPDLDGIFCTNDDLAVGAMLRCQQLGIKIPEQIAIAGYNALDIGKSIYPSLTSVNTPREEIGITAAKMLLEKLSGNEPRNKIKDVGYSIFLGDSIGELIE